MKFAHGTKLFSLAELNFNGENIHYQLPAEDLAQIAVSNREGVLNDTGALVIQTGKFTGRSPKDKFVVFDNTVKDRIDWNEFNNPIDPKHFDYILKQAVDYLNNQDELFVRDAYACADPKYKITFRVVNQTASMNLFAANM
ncbi:phosphoenolpyruvate carboxykinase (ATP) [Niabella ginsengisoli]|uniref:phosphoenolpyruvate carboxykinase (ATP) n=1 Tax=Niabella ginsengisoli TaxID=522298 RepID=UPI0021D40E74|nr:phosphoenolpyruvate carboxykinase (ATP) [Niabella ginsengisoli]